MSGIRLFRYGVLAGVTEFTEFWNWRTFFGGWMLQMLTQALFFALLARLFGSPDHERFLLIGNAVAVGAATIGWAIPASTWDRSYGTYPLLVIAPASLVPTTIGRTSVWLASGVVTVILMFLIFGLLFDLGLPWPDTFFLVPLVMLTCLSTYCLSLFLGTLVTRKPQFRNIFLVFLTIVARAFCGVSVPVAFWPDVVQFIVRLLPMTHGLQAIRLLLDEASTTSILQAAGFEAIVGLAWITLAILAMDRMANAGRRDGSIEFVQ